MMKRRRDNRIVIDVCLWPLDGVIGRPSLWIAEDFWVLRFRLMVKRGPWSLNAIGGNPRSTERWKDVPRGTMDEVSSYVRLDLLSVRRQGRHLDCSASSSHFFERSMLCA